MEKSRANDVHFTSVRACNFGATSHSDAFHRSPKVRTAENALVLFKIRNLLCTYFAYEYSKNWSKRPMRIPWKKLSGGSASFLWQKGSFVRSALKIIPSMNRFANEVNSFCGRRHLYVLIALGGLGRCSAVRRSAHAPDRAVARIM